MQYGATAVGDDTVFKITSVADALKAIEEIKEQGEGTTVSPFQGSFDPAETAHYYVFAQIQQGHRLQKGPDGLWHFNGPAIGMPGVRPFARSNDPHASDDFNVSLSDLLRLMQQAWTTGPATIDDAIDQMGVLRVKGTALIAAGVCPEFRWTDKTALKEATKTTGLHAPCHQPEADAKAGSHFAAIGLLRVSVHQFLRAWPDRLQMPMTCWMTHGILL